ncbi:hypothetical protein BRADI_3g57365v3 [Brachypodium distachyon]|uniref:Uncharacterized protein n=1 Tax=Brachypodium distachyon TaxID=15368 RepID=A0A0Q3JT93_BRADI|nr:hypothetical protein BRADI_3g57365v3 [Brachypodium distachyon]PNT69541.1 hypothetical protein BRADI_3g57365v3 [Brachypodium distachyon]
MNGKFQIKRTWKLTTEYSRREICNPIYSTPEIVAGSNSRRPHRKSPARTHLDLFYRFPARRRPLRDPSSARFSLMASLLLRSAGRVLRRSLQQGPLRRSPAQPFVDNPRRFSSDAVNKHSCAPENSLNSIEAGLDVNLQIMRATAEQAKVIYYRRSQRMN